MTAFEEFQKTGRFTPRDKFKESHPLHEECTDVIKYEGTDLVIQALSDNTFFLEVKHLSELITSVRSESLTTVESILWGRHVKQNTQ